MMDTMKATAEMMRLWRKWISRDTQNYSPTERIGVIKSSILRELRAARAEKFYTSPGLRSEMHGELIKCGKIRKAILG